jgi:pimeloyl-ACP methyl ester carboxylesterase
LALGLTLGLPAGCGTTGGRHVDERAAFSMLFAQDVPAVVRSALAAGQRPITLSALGTSSTTAAWKTLPSWYLIETDDKVRPKAAQQAMAERADSKITTVKASHLVMVPKPSSAVKEIL